MRTILVTAFLLGGSAWGRTVLAQDASARASYRALTQTPPGALPTPVGLSVTGSDRRGWTVHARYGLTSFNDEDYVHNVGIGVDVGVGSGRLGLTLGGYEPACGGGDCPGHFMTAVGYSERVVGAALGRTASSATLNLGLDLTAAFANPPGASLYAGAVGLPVTLVSSAPGFRVIPYLEPGLGTGWVRDHGETDAGIRATFGAGVAAIGLAPGFGFSAGVKRVFLRDGNWVVGVGLSYGR